MMDQNGHYIIDQMPLKFELRGVQTPIPLPMDFMSSMTFVPNITSLHPNITSNVTSNLPSVDNDSLPSSAATTFTESTEDSSDEQQLNVRITDRLLSVPMLVDQVDAVMATPPMNGMTGMNAMVSTNNVMSNDDMDVIAALLKLKNSGCSGIQNMDSTYSTETNPVIVRKGQIRSNMPVMREMTRLDQDDPEDSDYDLHLPPLPPSVSSSSVQMRSPTQLSTQSPLSRNRISNGLNGFTDPSLDRLAGNVTGIQGIGIGIAAPSKLKVSDANYVSTAITMGESTMSTPTKGGVPSCAPNKSVKSVHSKSSRSRETAKSVAKSTKKKHQCHLCPYSTPNRHHLLKHLRVHSGERPFECPICNKRYAVSFLN